MDIEEAIYILSEAVIDKPSIKSYEYIGAEEINMAVEVLLEELEKKEQKIKELNNLLYEQMNTKNESRVRDILKKIATPIFLEKQYEKNWQIS